MPRFDHIKSVARKAPIVMNSAKIINDQYENKEISNEEAYNKMLKFARSGNFKSFWFDIDDLLRQKYETEEWFWLVRRVRNNLQDL